MCVYSWSSPYNPHQVRAVEQQESSMRLPDAQLQCLRTERWVRGAETVAPEAAEPKSASTTSSLKQIDFFIMKCPLVVMASAICCVQIALGLAVGTQK